MCNGSVTVTRYSFFTCKVTGTKKKEESYVIDMDTDMKMNTNMKMYRFTASKLRF